MNSRERLQAMWNGEKVDRLPLMPITMMFAADLIGAKYGDYATDHQVLAKAQIATADAYELDYVSTISDPAREAADLGAEIEYFDNQPPALNESKALLADKAKLQSLKIPDMSQGRLGDRVNGVALLKQKIGDRKIVEGWIEGPCAQASDLRGINTLMLDFYDDPDFVQELFDFVLRLELKFAQAQLEAGADLIGIGDAAASLVGPKIYKQHVFAMQQKMVQALKEMGARVRLHICGKVRKIVEHLGTLQCDILDLDSMNPMGEARAQVGPDQVLLGNIAPVAVLKDGTADEVYNEIAECHRQTGPRYIAGAGCEVPRGTPHENMMALTRYAHEHAPDQFL